MSEPSSNIMDLFRELLIAAGEDPNRPALSRTPSRAFHTFLELTRGLRENPLLLLDNGIFDEESEGTVMVRNISFVSLCEHHLLPFSGHADLAYIPNGRVLGLSRIVRIVEHFAARPQIQERLGIQIADFIEEHIHPSALAVRLTARHMCMSARGIRQQTPDVRSTICRRSSACPEELWSSFQASFHD